MDKDKLGLMHIYCGDGKGKTTAAIGLSIRGAGSGCKVVFAQFLKNWDTGEMNIFKQIPQITIIRSETPMPFTFQMSEEQRQVAVAANNEILDLALAACASGDVDMLVLDELCAAYNKQMVDTKKVDAFLQNRTPNMELVVTGRKPPAHFLAMASYVSEIHMEKHPYNDGVPSRQGIEY